MTRAPTAPWRRLVPLTVLVLAVHLALLQAPPKRLATGRQEPVHFVTRTVRPPAPTPPVPAPAAAPAPTPEKIAPAPPPPVARAPVQPPRAAATPETPSAPAAPGPQVDTSPRSERPPPSSADPGGLAFVPQVLGVPEPARMHYELTVQARGLSVKGKASLDWRHDGQQYEARLELSGSAFPTRVQRSAGRITDDGLAPSYFSDKGRSEQATHFDREKGRLVFSNNRPGAALAEGMQDRLSVVVQLSMLIAGDPARFTAGTQIAIPTATTREADNWIFSVEGEEDLDLPGGKVTALKLQRLPRKEFDQKVELWLAPRMDYAPVRLRLTNPNGDAVDQRWASTDRG